MTALLQRYSVGRRLGAAFGLLIVLSGLLVATGLSSMASARKQLDFIVLDRMAKIQMGNGMLDANSSIMIALSTYAMATSEALNTQALEAIKAQHQRYKELREKLDTLPTSEEGRKIRKEMDAQRLISGKINDEVMALAAKDENAAAQALLNETGRQANAAWQDKIRQLVSRQDRAEPASLRRRCAVAEPRQVAVVYRRRGRGHHQRPACLADHPQPHPPASPRHQGRRSHCQGPTGQPGAVRRAR